ncbi:uncharacterized protein PHACADRAFT_250880 [Phanerochaete carnosa HHB-10118-sp]|uniref:Uncharacterized protein n=1 Tax=Phanerochaete carnosa (strain HHB-10118-sp) TaxID=650164 RepID=K5WKT3_PHACS|nr:uncharacterized protein PHACADRAFT_250880 [Phanerochaete carnosa HHB-10118-sp]EKM60025.1 hypothetical protein PHACADRAFT_250880 [Phanerochaete carnosa HHB-10118-sp]
MRRHGAPRISIGAWTDVPDSTVPVEGACSASHLFGTGLLEVSLSDSSAESIFLHVFSRLPLSTVQFLMIDEFPRAAYGGEPYMPSEVTWRDTFAHADDVHILSVSGRSAEHLPTALHPRDGTPALLFPKLRHLKLDRVAFLVVSLSDSMDAEDEVEDFWQRGRWYDAFVAALRARANLGKRVVKLTITGTDAITEAEVLELGNYVDDVVWDGRTGPVGTNDEQGARDYCSSMRGRL